MSNSNINSVMLSVSLVLSGIFLFPTRGQAETTIAPVSPPICNRDLDSEQVTQLQQKQAVYPGAYYQLGEYYTCQDHPSKALEAYQKAIALDPEFAHAYLAMGQHYVEQKKWEKAIATYTTVIELDPRLGEVYPRLALVYQQLNQPQNAQSSLNQALSLLKEPPFDARYSDSGYLEAQPHLQQGKQLLEQGKLGQAEIHLRRAISLNPSNTEAAFTLSNLFVQQNKLDVAINVVEQTYQYILKRLDEDQHPIQLGAPYISHFMMAQYFIAKEDHETAIAVFKKVLPSINQDYQILVSQKPANSQKNDLVTLNILRGRIQLQMGELLAQQGQSEAALAQFKTAAKNSSAPFTLSDIVELISTATTEQTRATSVQNADAEAEAKAYKYLGDSLLNQNSFTEAIAAYEQGLKIDPKSTHLSSSLGLAQLKNNQTVEAVQSYQTAFGHRYQVMEREADPASIKATATRHAAVELFRFGESEKAIVLLQTDLATALPQEEKHLHQEILARHYVQTQQYDLAVDLLQSIVVDAPDNRSPLLYTELAKIQIKQQQFAEATITAKELISRFPEQNSGYMTLAQIYAHQNQLKKAVSTYLSSNQFSSPSTPADASQSEMRATFQLAYQLQTQDNEEVALKLLHQLSDLAQQTQSLETDAIAQLKMADIYVSQRKYDLAVAHLNNPLLSSEAQQLPALSRERRHALLAKIYTHQGHYPKAIASYRQSQGTENLASSLLGVFPNTSQDVLAYSSLGHQLIEQSQPDLALEVLNLAIALQPDVSRPYELRGQLYEDQQKFNLAIRDYQSALNAIPDALKNKPSLSLTMIHSSLSELQMRWGRILLKQNNPTEAKVKLEKAIQANSNNQEAKELLKQAIAQSSSTY